MIATFNKIIHSFLLILLLFSCKDRGCVEGDDFGEFTTTKLLLPPEQSFSGMDFSASLCDVAFKAKMEEKNIVVNYYCTANGLSIAINCAKDFTGDNKNCRPAKNICIGANQIEIQRACLQEYFAATRSSPTINTTTVKTPANSGLAANTDISIKVRGKLTINYPLHNDSSILIASNDISKNIDVKSGMIQKFFLTNVESQRFFNIPNEPNSTTIDQHYCNSNTCNNNQRPVQTKGKEVFAYLQPYPQDYFQYLNYGKQIPNKPSPKAFTCKTDNFQLICGGSDMKSNFYGPLLPASSTPEDTVKKTNFNTFFSQQLDIDNSRDDNKVNMSTGLIVKHNINSSDYAVPNLVNSNYYALKANVYYQIESTTNNICSDVGCNAADSGVVSGFFDISGSNFKFKTKLNETTIIKSASDKNIYFDSAVTILPLLSLDLNSTINPLSGYAYFGFLQRADVGKSRSSKINIILLNQDGSTEIATPAPLDLQSQDYAYGSTPSSCNDSIACAEFNNSKITTSNKQIQIRKNQIILISPQSGTTAQLADEAKQYGLFIDTNPRPSLYCYNQKYFLMQKNPLCLANQPFSSKYSTADKTKCQISLQDTCKGITSGSTSYSCDNTNVQLQEIQNTAINPTLSTTTPPDPCSVCFDIIKTPTTAQYNQSPISGIYNLFFNAVADAKKALYRHDFYEPVCFDLENYQGKKQSIDNSLASLTATYENVDDLELKLSALFAKGLRFANYFNGSGYGILPKITYSGNSNNPLHTSITTSLDGKLHFALNEEGKSLNISSYGGSFTLQDGEGLDIILEKQEEIPIKYNDRADGKIIDANETWKNVYDFKSGNIVRNNKDYDSAINICKRDDYPYPQKGTYQEVFCFNEQSGQDQDFLLEFKLNTNSIGLKKGCKKYNNLFEDCDPGLDRNCDKYKLPNPKYSASSANTCPASQNNYTTVSASENQCLYICEDDILRYINGNYNINVTTKDKKDIPKYVDLILKPINNIMYSQQPDCAFVTESKKGNNYSIPCSAGDKDCDEIAKMNEIPVKCPVKKWGYSFESNDKIYKCLGKSINNPAKTVSDNSFCKIKNYNDSDRPTDCNAICTPAQIGEIERTYKDIVNNGKFATIVRISASLMIIFYAISYLMGINKLNQGEIINRIIKIGIIYLFIDPTLGWYWFNEYVVKFFDGGTDYLSYLMASILEPEGQTQISNALANRDFSDKALLFATANDIFGLLTSEQTWKKIFALFFFDLFGPIYLLIVLYAVFSYVFIIANVLLIYVTAKLLIGMLFLVAPIFIAFLLFKRTQEYFNKWLNTIISFALQQIFVIFCLNIFNMLIYYIFKLVLGFKICWDSVWQVNLGAISFTILEFWTPYANPSAPKLGKDPNLYQPEANVPSIVSILLLWIIVKIMKDFIPKVADLANTLAEGADSAVRYTQSIADNLEKLEKHPFAPTRRVFDALGSAFGYKNASSRLLSFGSEKLLNFGGVYSERQKQGFMKKEEQMRKDKAAVMMAGDDAVAKYKKENLADFANGKKTEKDLKAARIDAMQEKLADIRLERSAGSKSFEEAKAQGIKNALEFAKDQNLSAKELNDLKKLFIREEINKLRQKTVMNYDFSLNEKGKLSSEYFAKHDSVAGLAFSLAKERFEKGGTLTSTLVEQAKAKKEDAKVSEKEARDAGIDIKTMPAENFRQNTWKESAGVVLNTPLKLSSAKYQELRENGHNRILSATAGGLVGFGVAVGGTVGGVIGVVGAVSAIGIAAVATPFVALGATAYGAYRAIGVVKDIGFARAAQATRVAGSTVASGAAGAFRAAVDSGAYRTKYALVAGVVEAYRIATSFPKIVDSDVADGPIANAPSAYDIPYIGGTPPTAEESSSVGSASPAAEESPPTSRTPPAAEIYTGAGLGLDHDD